LIARVVKSSQFVCCVLADGGSLPSIEGNLAYVAGHRSSFA
jgi:hypothetical protein